MTEPEHEKEFRIRMTIAVDVMAFTEAEAKEAAAASTHNWIDWNVCDEDANSVFDAMKVVKKDDDRPWEERLIES